MGQADTYEIFPLLTLATASAAGINPLSAQHTHTFTHDFLATIGNKAVATTVFPNTVVIITASVDLFQPHLTVPQQQRRQDER